MRVHAVAAAVDTADAVAAYLAVVVLVFVSGAVAHFGPSKTIMKRV